MDLQELFSFIRQVGIFSLYGDEELDGLLKTARLRSYHAGELVFEEGDPGDAFYVIYSGRVRILKRGEEKKEINLALLTRGDQFGETALITDHPRNAAARAVEETTLVIIDKESFNEHIFAVPRLREHFDKFTRYSSIYNYVRSCSHLSAVPPAELRELVNGFQSEFVQANEVVFRQGSEADKFYLIEKGKVKVIRWEGSRQEIINFLREGDFFGEKALVEEGVRYADIVCLTDCHFFTLGKSDFQKLILKSPKLKKTIEDRIGSYVAGKPPIPYRELILQELEAEKKPEKLEAPPTEEIREGRERANRFQGLASFYHRHVRFPFIRQHDEMTCGTTCLMMIARYYGKHFSSNRLRELARVDVSGASLANLASAAEQIGFSARAMRLGLDRLGSVPFPCIAHWQGYHYVVVHKMDDKHVWVADPALGLRRYEREFFKNNWTGIALILEPTPALEEQVEDASSFRRYLQFIRPHRLVLAEVFAASVLINILGLAIPVFTQNIVDRVLVHHNLSMLNVMFAGILIVLLLRMLMTTIRQYLIVHTSIKVDLHMLVFFYKHLLSLPLGYYKVRKIGDFITRFSENLKIREFMTNTALTITLDAVLVVVYLSLMCYYSLEIVGVVVAFIAAFSLLTVFFTPVLKRLNIEAFSARAESESHLIESIHAIDTIKAMNLEYPTRWKWEDKFIRTLNIDFRLYNTAGYFNAFGGFLAGLSSAVVLWYGARKVMDGALTVGQLMAFVTLMGSVLTPIASIMGAWDRIQQTLVSVDRLNDVFEAKPEFPEMSGRPPGIFLKDVQGAVEFQGVYFRYGGGDSPHILSNINMKAAPGQTVAIVGRSGSGKSTLVRLLPRLYDVTEGKITVDGVDVKNVHLGCLRRMVGFVLQENFIFNGSVRENISMGDPEENVERVIEAARLANAHDFISSLAQGYETHIGESGLQLSGGQKQRIAIARVIYSNPKIIIFDEATSSLDSESERAIQKNLGTLLKNRTAFIIAHRLSTVRDADHIVVLDRGEIIEQGTHDELLQKNGLYHYLVHQQLNLQ